jgi:hypothetical protein
MLMACYCHAVGNLQIKGLPEELHERLKERAAEAGMTQRDYVLKLIERDLRVPSKAEWLQRVRARSPVPGVDGAEAVRESRAERIDELNARVDERLGHGLL